MIRGYLESLYDFRGQWVTFPIDEEEYKEIWDDLSHDGKHDVIFADWDGTNLGEFADVATLNRIGELEEDELEAFELIFQEHVARCDIEHALEIVENGEYTIFNDCWSDSDLGEQVFDLFDVGIDFPEMALRYFDYEGYGRDFRIEESVYEDYNGRALWVHD